MLLAGLTDLWLFKVLEILGSLGLFIFGMKIMSEGLQKLAGKKLREILRGMTSNRFSGILTGFLTTCLVQSSSATTVMVVSFVNAGLLSLVESMGVVMGANIGTTFTLWMVTLFGFKFKVSYISLTAIGIFFPFLFSNRQRLKHLGEFFIGFGILFIGLDLLKDAVPNIDGDSPILEYTRQLSNMGIVSRLIFLGIGTLLTVIVQSSSAASTITLVLLAKGYIDLPIAAAMILGENIGTTITANLAAIVGNVHAKRTARFHFLFNVIGVIWMIAIMPLFLKVIHGSMDGLLHFIADKTNDPSVFQSPDKYLLAMFHTSFNLANTLLLVWFVPIMARLVIRMQPSRSDEDEEHHLRFLNSGMMSTTELTISNARKVLEGFVTLVDKMSHNVEALVFEQKKRPEKLINKIYEREQMTDTIEVELATYLTKVAEYGISEATATRITAMLSIANDLERMGDTYYAMTKNFERVRENGLRFPEEAKKDLAQMFELVHGSFKISRRNFAIEGEGIDMESIRENELNINSHRNKIFQRHFRRLEKGLYDPESGIIFIDFVNRLERIGDQIVNINEDLQDSLGA